MSSKLRAASNGAWGILAQALSLAATFLPVVFQQDDALVVLVTFTALATVVTPLMSLAAQVRIPSLATALQVRAQVVAALATSVVGSVAVLVVGVVVGARAEVGGQFEAAAVLSALCLAQALFTLCYSLLVRRSKYRDMMLARLTYSLATFLLTLWVVLSNGDGILLCLAAAGGFLSGAGFAVIVLRASRPRAIKPRRVKLTFVLAGRAIRSSAALSASLTVGAIAGQVGALVTPTLGSLSGPWALMMRVMSGFQTLGVVVIGSSVDARVAAAARARDTLSVRHASRGALLFGIMIGGLSAVFAFIVAAVGVASVDESELVYLLIAAVGFVGSSVALAPMGRILGIVGKPSVRLAWDSIRCATIVPALILQPHASLLLLSVAGVFSFVSYVLLLRRGLAR